MVQFEVTNIRLHKEWSGCGGGATRALDFSLVTHTGEEALPLIEVVSCEQLPCQDGESSCPAAVSTPVTATSHFMQLVTSVSQSGQPLSLLGRTDNYGSNDWTWSLEGEVSISYWIQVPDEDDCPL